MFTSAIVHKTLVGVHTCCAVNQRYIATLLAIAQGSVKVEVFTVRGASYNTIKLNLKTKNLIHGFDTLEITEVTLKNDYSANNYQLIKYS